MDRDILRGTQIDGFQIVRRLGRGGMGEVFEAVRTGPGGFRRAVALKRLLGNEAVGGAAVQRFLAEARILSSLHHPNVIEVYDVIVGAAGHVLVMELLTGLTLGALVRATREHGGLPVAELCAIADRALAGLGYVHAARGEDGRALGLIHRDLTPNNLFITDAGEVKLIDFGIAKLREALDAPVTRDGEVHGTLELIAPEQARGEPTDPRTDLYQLAATLYWALTLRYPHGTGTTVELLARAALQRPPLLAELRPDLPRALSDAIDRAMALAPGDRFADAAAMRAALRSLVPADGDVRLEARVRSLAGAASEATLVDPDPAPTATLGPPETVADRPSARRAEAPGNRPAIAAARRRWWPVAAISGAAAAGGLALWLHGSAPQVIARSDARVEAAPSLAEIPNTQGALGAAPLSGDRVVVATAHGVRTISARGDDARTLDVPADLAPVDVEALSGDRVAVTGQGSDGRFKTFIAGDASRTLVTRMDQGVVATRPDGASVARADRGYSARLESGKLESRIVVPITIGSDVVVALAWSPDGARLAAIRVRGHTDPTIEIATVDDTTAPPRELNHRPFEGSIALFGWLDADQLVYAVNRADDAALFSFSVGAQAEVLIARLPGERIVGGHVGHGAIAVLHGAPKHRLLLGTTHDVRVLPLDVATSLGGFEPSGGLVLGTAGGVPQLRTPVGVEKPWPGGEPGDRPQTASDGVVLAVRRGELFRLGPAPRRLLTASAPADSSIVRCAGDAVAPCVVVDASERWIRYRLFDPETGKLADSWLTENHGVDHAVSRDGKMLAIVDGGDTIRVDELATGTLGWRRVGGGAGLDAIAWSGDELIVSARGWRQHPWALLAVDPAGKVRSITESTARVTAEIRATTDAIAVVTSEVTPVLSLIHVP